MKMINLAGQRFGYMDVLRFSHTEKSHAMWLCRCECGVEKAVAGKLLRAGKTVSCGCKRGKKRIYDDYSLRRKELHEMNPDKANERLRRFREKHKERLAEQNRHYSSLYRAKRVKRRAMPAWADKTAINLVYKKARELGWTVDHIVPLQSKTVCGLHVWHNLQVMDSQLNKSKSNRFWPDMP